MNMFAVDTQNADRNIPTNQLHQMTTSPTSTSDKGAGFVIVSGGVEQIYTAITHWMNMLANRNPTLDDSSLPSRVS